MIGLSQAATNDEAVRSGKPEILGAIRRAIQMCRDLQQVRLDSAVHHELLELEFLEGATSREWPLPAHIKQSISIGPFAAKNIEDWNTPLANALMDLDFALRHDGLSA